MKYLKIFVLMATLAGFASCTNDDPSSDSIFDTTPPSRNEFDQWLKKNYTDTYNVQFNYLYNDNLSDLSYNVVPATITNSKAIAILMKHVWMDAYSEVMGTDFLKNKCFRQIQLIGSAEHSGQGSIILGTAEGGLKVLLFRLNELDPDNVFINQDDPYRDQSEYPLDLNFWYFHTMHHEFCHILTQTVNYSTDFQFISAGHYHSADWVNVSDKEAAPEGFVTGYASGEYNEDFAETYSVYVTNSEKGWQKILEQAVVNVTDADGNVIYQKDAKGNDLEEYDLDKDGNKILATDANGGLVPEKDAAGNIIYATDKSGNYIYVTDNKGGKIPVRETQSKSLFYDPDGKNIYWIYGGQLYPLTTPLASDKIVYQTTIDGDTVYDKSGNPIPEYYRLPVYAYKKHKVPQTDDTGKKIILQKLDIVKSYFKDVWGVDLDKLREVVLRRSKEAPNLDLTKLK